MKSSLNNEAATPEPAGTTLGDLVALVIGAALAAGMTWYSGREYLRTLAGAPAPGWYIVLLYLTEIFRKGCVALLPVIIARRVRYGGPIRAGEFAALTVAVPLLTRALQQWPALGIMIQPIAAEYLYVYRPGAFWPWTVAQLTVCFLAGVIVVVAHRRLPASVIGALVLLAWYGLDVPPQIICQEGFNTVIPTIVKSFATMQTLQTLCVWLPFGIIGLLPVAYAALDLLRTGRTGRTWLEWSGFGLAACWWLVFKMQIAFRFESKDLLTWGAVNQILIMALPFVQAIVALAVAWRFGPAWRRWIETDDSPTLVPEREAAIVESSVGD